MYGQQNIKLLANVAAHRLADTELIRLLAKLKHTQQTTTTVERRMRATEVQRFSFLWIMTNVYYNCATNILTLSNTKLWPGFRNDKNTDNRQNNIGLNEVFRLHQLTNIPRMQA
jgi:hypothetical protein